MHSVIHIFCLLNRFSFYITLLSLEAISCQTETVFTVKLYLGIKFTKNAKENSGSKDKICFPSKSLQNEPRELLFTCQNIWTACECTGTDNRKYLFFHLKFCSYNKPKLFYFQLI